MKKIVALFLVFSLIFSVTACGSKDVEVMDRLHLIGKFLT